MAAQIETLVDFAYKLRAIVDLDFRDGGDPDETLCYPEFTKEGDTSQGANYITNSTVGLGAWGRTDELGGFHKDAHQKGRHRETYFMIKWTNGTMVSQDLMFQLKRNKRVREEQMPILEDRNQQLKSGYNWVKELVGLYYQTKGRSATPDGVWPGLGSDGLVLFSLVHKTIKAPQQTVNNAQAAQPLTMMAMIENEAMHMNMKGDDNRPGRNPASVTYQIGRYNKTKIKAPLYNDRMPGTANNDINLLTKGGKDEYKTDRTYIVNQYLDANDTSWMSWTKAHMMYFFEPTSVITFLSEVDASTSALISKGTNWFGIDWHSFRGAVQAPSS